MKITADFIKNALKTYDDQTSYYKRTKFLFAGEYADVAEVRVLRRQLEKNAEELSEKECFSLVSILIKSKPLGEKHPDHDHLFEQLKDAVGTELLQAMRILNKYGRFNQENYHRVVNHTNPIALAKALNQLEKYPAILEEKDMQFEADDPYTPAKRQTAMHAACSLLEEARLNTGANKALVMKDPVGFAHVLKKFKAKSVVVTQDYLFVIGAHQDVKSMGCAVLQLRELIAATENMEIKKLENTFLAKASKHPSPFAFTMGLEILSKCKDLLLNPAVVSQIEQSNMPVETATLISIDYLFKVYSNASSALKLLTRIGLLYQGTSLEEINATRMGLEEKIKQSGASSSLG